MNWTRQLVANLNSKPDKGNVQCPITHLVIYRVSGEGNRKTIRNYGECRSCNKSFHISEIKMAPFVLYGKEPIAYEGVLCKSCYNLPLNKVKTIQDETF